MNSMSLMYQARMYSIVAQMEGMIAANKARISDGYALAYTSEDFNEISNDLERVVESLAECVNYD